MNRRASSFVSLALAAVALALGGCQQWVIERLSEAPNHGVATDTRYETCACVRGLLGIDREVFVSIEEPAATIRAWVLEPDASATAGGEPRGTVVVLHGLRVSSFWMMVKARDLTDAGYRAVMIDLRGHGGSTGDWFSYGYHESRDVIAVIDALESDGLIAGRLGVWGISLGATTALQAAGRDTRIEAVVAVTPFTNARAVGRHVIGEVIPFGDRYTDEQVDAIIDAVGERGSFDPDEADAVAGIERTKARVLIVGGECDWITPIDHARAIHAAVPDRSERITLPMTGHIFAGVDVGWRVKRASVQWFDRYLAGDGLAR